MPRVTEQNCFVEHSSFYLELIDDLGHDIDFDAELVHRNERGDLVLVGIQALPVLDHEVVRALETSHLWRKKITAQKNLCPLGKFCEGWVKRNRRKRCGRREETKPSFISRMSKYCHVPCTIHMNFVYITNLLPMHKPKCTYFRENDC